VPVGKRRQRVDATGPEQKSDGNTPHADLPV
jgi:hypothetical protein